MDPESIRSVGRAPHGGTSDRDLLDFSANTNPRHPRGVEAIYRSAFEHARSYPRDPPTPFHTAASEYVGCPEGSVIATAGGMAAIRLAISVGVARGDSVVIPEPSFAEYEREVRLRGATPTFVPEADVLAIDPSDHALVIICQPNNPTGRIYHPDRIREFAAECRKADTRVLVDEAFLDFTAHPSVGGTDGVIVARSLTKIFGLPGLRVGFAIATGRVRDALDAARLPWNVSTPGLMVGTYCLDQTRFVMMTRRRVRSERARMRDRLAREFAVTAGEGPFLLVSVGDRDVASLVTMAREEGIVIRDATTFRGLDNHVRIAVRVPSENDQVLDVMRDV